MPNARGWHWFKSKSSDCFKSCESPLAEKTPHRRFKGKLKVLTRNWWQMDLFPGWLLSGFSACFFVIGFRERSSMLKANPVRAVLAKFCADLNSSITALGIAWIFARETLTPACRTVSKHPDLLDKTSCFGQFRGKTSLRWRKTRLLNRLCEPIPGWKYTGKFGMELFNQLIFS